MRSKINQKMRFKINQKMIINKFIIALFYFDRIKLNHGYNFGYE